ncbi:methylated-DNA--[protein]-cysteine S-methyltransferase [Streptomyces litchfieldiae]|uniref:Methylated-DNA--[protein]-cysteine S-methyltransferase n=1 Tax=Streptomyces litchfieldiae TaxID=3075543 RepID=A0ABU2N0H1_9ACTN|nr:methylated-DNA--[protein]-cysteine S-methyltransferase [Streptomyces sp. DSM 44938]MDT0347402.1 methylated-DNA--[protein]-cysteine S-methyltransferase [Streptomyces sp. DSM 44938]
MRTQRAVLTAHRTAVGPMVLAVTDEALVYCGFDTIESAGQRVARAGLRSAGTADATPPETKILDETRAQLDGYLAGRTRDFSLPLDLRLATALSRTTVSALGRFVPYGRTATYGELARALGRPGAARAVGTALGANPLCVVLPCHRVLASGGRISGYAGGVEAKRFLLELEGRAS